MKFIKRVNPASYIADQTVNITISGVPGSDSDTVENVPLAPDSALEVELDDGSVYILLGYKRK